MPPKKPEKTKFTKAEKVVPDVDVAAVAARKAHANRKAEGDKFLQLEEAAWAEHARWIKTVTDVLDTVERSSMSIDADKIRRLTCVKKWRKKAATTFGCLSDKQRQAYRDMVR